MDNISNTLSAGMEKQEVSQYVSQREEALTKLNEIENKINSIKIKTIANSIIFILVIMRSPFV